MKTISFETKSAIILNNQERIWKTSKLINSLKELISKNKIELVCEDRNHMANMKLANTYPEVKSECVRHETIINRINKEIASLEAKVSRLNSFLSGLKQRENRLYEIEHSF